MPNISHLCCPNLLLSQEILQHSGESKHGIRANPGQVVNWIMSSLCLLIIYLKCIGLWVIYRDEQYQPALQTTQINFFQFLVLVILCSRDTAYFSPFLVWLSNFVFPVMLSLKRLYVLRAYNTYKVFTLMSLNEQVLYNQIKWSTAKHHILYIIDIREGDHSKILTNIKVATCSWWMHHWTSSSNTHGRKYLLSIEELQMIFRKHNLQYCSCNDFNAICKTEKKMSSHRQTQSWCCYPLFRRKLDLCATETKKLLTFSITLSQRKQAGGLFSPLL